MEKTRIFISYKRKNKDQVFSIVKKIETQLGVKCWVDLDGIESSAQFASKICKAIDTAEVVLFMHSSVHLDIDFEQDWTIKELNYAHAKKKRVVLVKLDNAPLDNIFLMEYGSKNNIDSQDETQFQKLLKDLKGWLSISSNAQNTVQTRNEISERTTATQEEMKICADYIYMVEHRAPIVASALGKTTTIEVTDVTETGKKVEALAKKGITEAEYAIGFGNYNRNRYWSMGGDEKYKKAEYWLERAAKKGHVKAQATLAEMYYWGNEPEKSIPWALPASQKNNMNAAQILAWCYRDKNEKKNYLNTIKIAAEIQITTKDKDIHNPALQYGKALLENGNLEEALQWFNEAIDLAYDAKKKGEAIYHKAKTLYQQGHKLKALKCLDIVAPDDPYGYSCSELAKKIKSELNPFSKFFKK